MLVRFNSSIKGNTATYERYQARLSKKFDPSNVITIDLALHEVRSFDLALAKALWGIPTTHRNIWVDTSGLPAQAVCSVLRVVRIVRPVEPQTVIYTAAREYIPSKAEYDDLVSRHPDGIDFLPRSMALEMAENLIPDPFSGHRTNDGKTALAVFAGYEVHRSAGVIDNINPSVLLLLYGRPGNDNLEWRLSLSQQLHSKFERARRCAAEVVSTLKLSESLAMLEKYYDYLFDEYDLTIAPICSKMHAVAAYMFWEKYKEVQLAFPLPVGYDSSNRPLGFGETYQLTLPPSRLL